MLPQATKEDFVAANLEGTACHSLGVDILKELFFWKASLTMPRTNNTLAKWYLMQR
jgi:hypothetical protein